MPFADVTIRVPGADARTPATRTLQASPIVVAVRATAWLVRFADAQRVRLRFALDVTATAGAASLGFRYLGLELQLGGLGNLRRRLDLPSGNRIAPRFLRVAGVIGEAGRNRGEDGGGWVRDRRDDAPRRGGVLT